ncbi:unnamed protein product [Owenia fusiformis]|uniref:Uncharacterized protein n=1 Tax=Owenia fusiformis TaxID=6347 RepID=A0A8J1XKH3_OWEFU|nr:unnamed protein product [Owenia fusiformis]
MEAMMPCKTETINIKEAWTQKQERKNNLSIALPTIQKKRNLTGVSQNQNDKFGGKKKGNDFSKDRRPSKCKEITLKLTRMSTKSGTEHFITSMTEREISDSTDSCSGGNLTPLMERFLADSTKENMAFKNRRTSIQRRIGCRDEYKEEKSCSMTKGEIEAFTEQEGILSFYSSANASTSAANSEWQDVKGSLYPQLTNRNLHVPQNQWT